MRRTRNAWEANLSVMRKPRFPDNSLSAYRNRFSMETKGSPPSWVMPFDEGGVRISVVTIGADLMKRVSQQ